MSDPTCLSYWFPKLEAAGLPVPRTIILDMSKDAQSVVWSAFDGQDGGDKEAFNEFMERLIGACVDVGYPAFLRTGHTSHKHAWNRTCFATAESDLLQHVFELAEFSECADIFGMPWEKWVVREFLPTMPIGVCPHYGDMPLCREFRFFVDDAEVRCFHPYWPAYAIEQGGADPALAAVLSTIDPQTEFQLRKLASSAGAEVGGSWSVDLLETKRGWFITDMAEAHKSFHWDGCDKAALVAQRIEQRGLLNPRSQVRFLPSARAGGITFGQSRK